MPRPETIQKALESIKREADYNYFFEKLSNPSWIDPLWAKGFFQNPPSPQKSERGISFPFWPESRFLARVAGKDPEKVLEVISKIPPSENSRIYEDIVKAALAMPATLAAKIVPILSERLKADMLLVLLPQETTDLIIYLSQNGESAASLPLVEALFGISDNVTEGKIGKDLQPRAWREPWHYRESLKKIVPVLAPNSGMRAFDLFCRLLHRALELLKQMRENDSVDQYSYIWRPAIEKNREQHMRGVENALVSAVRDTGELIITLGIDSLQNIIERLFREKSSVFKRIALHIVRISKTADPTTIAKLVLDRDLFDAPWAQHEYALLIRDKFGMLPVRQRDEYIGWVCQGLDPRLKENLEEKDRTPYEERWKRDKFSLIAAHLPKDAATALHGLIEKHGAPKDPEFLASTMVSWSGPTSPKSDDQLKEMSPAELVKYLKTWVPPMEDMSDSREGLSRAITAVVQATPTIYAPLAREFSSVDPTYVRGLLQGFENAAKEEKSFSWDEIIGLCNWVAEQPREIPGRPRPRQGHLDSDPDWTWTRKRIASLLMQGLTQEKPARLDLKYRKSVWQILSILVNDPDPTPEDEARDPSNFDPSTASINSVRGEALHAIIRYALWVRNTVIEEGKDKKSFTFSDIPEVRSVLDEHLDVRKDPSLAIRSVYGQWFPWLVLLDTDWTKTKTPIIFPKSSPLLKYRASAWETYLWASPAYDNVFDLLFEDYKDSIQNIGNTVFTKRLGTQTDENLMEHLMTFAWRGKIPIEGEILTSFWAKAPNELRAKAIDYIGRSLHQTIGDVPSNILERLQQLWELRLAFVKKQADAGKKSQELEGFGYWFFSAKLPIEWSLNQLTAALKYSEKMDADHFVCERLSQTFDSSPKMTLEALEALIKIDHETWIVTGSQDKIMDILSKGIRHPDPTIKMMAEDIIHYLGAKQHFAFGKLLQGE